jgi:prepilin peptidase CpaA
MLITLTLIIFPALMVFSAMSDLVTMTISNKVSLALIAGFLIIAPLAGIPISIIGWHILTASIVLAVTFALFAGGWIGGGDAKLAMATSIWLGPTLTIHYLLLATILGGALTLTMLAMRNYPWPLMLDNIPWIARLYRVDKGIPYGIALGFAGLIVYPSSLIWQITIGLG